MRLFVAALVLSASALPLAALAKKPPQPDDAEAPKASASRTSTQETTDATGIIRQEIDLDGNGRVDVINLLRDRGNGTRLAVKKEVDLNLDGRVDVQSEFDAAGALEVERMDTDFDGEFDWTDYYKDGARVLAELDSDFDGRVDTWTYYMTDGSGRTMPDRKERDTNRDGRVDVWERFDAAGNVIRVGRDTDNDGKMDEREE
jgi:hypothetical protein